MGCGCGGGPKKYKNEKIKTKKKSIKTSKLSISKTKPKPTSKISPIIKQQVPVVSKIAVDKPSRNVRLLKNCPQCKAQMREISKLGEGKYMECINPECRYIRKNSN